MVALFVVKHAKKWYLRRKKVKKMLLKRGILQKILILLRVFLMDGKEAYVLLDEPENSLDISWQYELINTLVKINPNAQYFITTHSPSIFGDGWGDKIIYMEDITAK